MTVCGNSAHRCAAAVGFLVCLALAAAVAAPPRKVARPPARRAAAARQARAGASRRAAKRKPRTRTVTVEVTDAQGRPVAGARAGTGGALRPTGPDGRLVLREKSRRATVLRVIGPGSDTGGVATADAGGNTRVAVVLGPAATVRGRVVDAAGNVQPKRSVYYTLRIRRDDGGYVSTAGQTHTDEQGGYVVEGVPVGAQCRMTLFRLPVEEVAKGSVAVNVIEQGEAPAEDLVVLPATVLRGRVLSHDTGVAVAGCSVRAWRVRGATTGTARLTAVGRPGRTEADGTFALSVNRETGAAHLLLTAQGRGSSSAGLLEVDGDTDRASLDVRLQPALTATGRVVDTTGAGRAELRVYARVLHRLASGAEAELHGGVAQTGSDGRFRIAGIPPAQRHLLWVYDGSGEARYRRGTSTHRRARLLKSVPVTLKPDAATDLGEVLLDVGLHLQILDDDGFPLEGVQVTVTKDGVPTPQDVVTDEDGMVTIDAPRGQDDFRGAGVMIEGIDYPELYELPEPRGQVIRVSFP